MMFKKVLLGLLVFSGLISLSVFPQQALKINDILKSPQMYQHSVIALVGIAGTNFEGDLKTPRHYLLQDASGTIQIYSTRPWPTPGARYAVVGSVTIDPNLGSVAINEQSAPMPLDKSFRIRDIRNNPVEYPEPVTIKGIVTQYLDSKSTKTYWYVIKDDWGDEFPVRSTKLHPKNNTRYAITGLVTVDSTTAPTEVFLSEDIRIEEAQLPQQQTQQEQVIEPPPYKVPFWKKTLFLLIVGASIILIILAFVISSLLRKKTAPEERIHHEFEMPIKTESKKEEIKLPEPQEVLEGDTVKIALPPQGTLKMLPGRLLVLSGEQKVREIRFYKTKSEEENEITFGRAAGKPYCHIQLKEMTVSAKHAKLIYAGKKFTIINYSKTNPTRVNDIELEENGMRELKDGDKIQIGEIIFQFFSK